MNFFMYSKCGEGAGLLSRLQDEGNSCKLFIKEKDYSSVYDGIIDKANEPEKDAIIIFDSSGNGRVADRYRRLGFKVFGASSFHDRLENDRDFGLDFMTEHGIKTPKTECFMTFSEGIKFLKKNSDKRYVFKPSGDLPSRLTYCGSDIDDLIHYLEYVQTYYENKIDDFILQEFIEGSIVSTELWCGPQGFVLRPNHTVEVKKLMNDDLGPSTGCSGNIVWLADENDIVVNLLRHIEDDLIKNNYVGPIDINTIIEDNVPYGLEWTPRFGLDAMPTFLQLINDDTGQMISDICQGLNPKTNILDCFAGGIRVSIPPYPIELDDAREVQKNSPNKGIPIRGLDEHNNTYFYEVERKDKELVHSDGTGVIAVISDWDRDVNDCLATPYGILEECKIPDKQYRTDLREVLVQMYEGVKKELTK